MAFTTANAFVGWLALNRCDIACTAMVKMPALRRLHLIECALWKVGAMASLAVDGCESM